MTNNVLKALKLTLGYHLRHVMKIQGLSNCPKYKECEGVCPLAAHKGKATSEDKNRLDAIVINEAQLILAEKRTSLSVLRTGIAVLVLPMSVMSVLIATSKYYSFLNVLHFLLPLGVLNLLLIVFGTYLIIRSIIRMKHHDRLIAEIKKKYSIIGKYID